MSSMRAVEALERPRLRGVLHQWAFFVALAGGVVLVAIATGPRERVAAAVFAVCLAGMFGVSALYHRLTWRPGPRRLMRRLDHAMIYLLIAGTYTPFCLLVLSGAWQATVLAIAWSGAVAATLFKLLWVDAPKWLAAVFGVALGWVGLVAFPQFLRVDVAIGVLLLAGGVLYTAGSVIYARGKPDPVPAVFGYHELFHALVVAAAACQYVAVVFVVTG